MYAGIKNSNPGRDFVFGPDYIVPTPQDPRLIRKVTCSITRAAEKSGVAKQSIADYDSYKDKLSNYRMK